MNKQTHSYYKKVNKEFKFKQEFKFKEEFKHDSITIKKWSPTYPLPEFKIILDKSLAFTIKVHKCSYTGSSLSIKI